MGSPITMITVARTTIAIALLMAIRPAAAGYFGEDKWIANCRYPIIEKRHPNDQPEWLMVIEPADLPVLEKEIKNLKKCMLFHKCLEDRDAGKVKHCYENDKRWKVR
jgi:hypothetical protein